MIAFEMENAVVDSVLIWKTYKNSVSTNFLTIQDTKKNRFPKTQHYSCIFFNFPPYLSEPIYSCFTANQTNCNCFE